MKNQTKHQISEESLLMQYAKTILKNFIQEVHGRIKLLLKIWTTGSILSKFIIFLVVFCYNFFRFETFFLMYSMCTVYFELKIFSKNEIFNLTTFWSTKALSQPAFSCSKLTIETLEEAVKYVQS